jgi:hypothetical protein
MKPSAWLPRRATFDFNSPSNPALGPGCNRGGRETLEEHSVLREKIVSPQGEMEKARVPPQRTRRITLKLKMNSDSVGTKSRCPFGLWLPARCCLAPLPWNNSMHAYRRRLRTSSGSAGFPRLAFPCLTSATSLPATPPCRPLFGVAIAHVYHHNDAISRVHDLRLYI